LDAGCRRRRHITIAAQPALHRCCAAILIPHLFAASIAVLRVFQYQVWLFFFCT
jgi:hypothetical protein